MEVVTELFLRPLFEKEPPTPLLCILSSETGAACACLDDA